MRAAVYLARFITTLTLEAALVSVSDCSMTVMQCLNMRAAVYLAKSIATLTLPPGRCP